MPFFLSTRSALLDGDNERLIFLFVLALLYFFRSIRWEEVPNAAGRLIVSVTQPSFGGLFINDPLSDQVEVMKRAEGAGGGYQW
jgi:hypothetical protein